jgi:hypothetical protein
MLFRAIGVIRFGPNDLPNSAFDWFTPVLAHVVLGFTLLNGGVDMMSFVFAGVVFRSLYWPLGSHDK